MHANYKYLYTCFNIFGSLPTHKVFMSDTSNQSKLIFADNSFIYGSVSDWVLRNSGLDSRKATWEEESKLFLNKEREKLISYRSTHPLFQTESTSY
ncbi:hypothetical protein [Acinetobacter sp. ANC 3832]|uniref:hypothetical protein n=1 Tax=Acinetobacter sp. ANC 3832 TaxID=1977874 RepID=UPI000A3446D2|nr:hypothetical protein [Acinetobacter sp. ANC 3832]OTG94975.1 hypothetical protein B9T35_06330 [Acinetobacter sp. ANC 3832]